MNMAEEVEVPQVVKMLNLGKSGTGKTGSLCSLAMAGYHLHILDYDNGVNIIRNTLREECPAALAKVTYEPLRDKIKLVNGIPKLQKPLTAYASAGKILGEWIDKGLGPNDVVVLDTLSTFSQCAFDYGLSLSGRLYERPQLQDYGWMADSVRLFIELLTSPDLNCHVVVNTHVRFLADEEIALLISYSTDPKKEVDVEAAKTTGLPDAKGQEIPRIVARYFNTTTLSRSLGQGPGARREITTIPIGVVEVKSSAPKTVKAKYPIETGMAQLFEDILGHPGPGLGLETQT